MVTRSPICTVVGHVDHGKSSILDQIRGSNIVSKEAGAITQAIGASIVPIDTIKKRCGKLLEQTKMDFNIPGLLFIDTPGHEAFTNLRKRGGNLADIAILVIDINEGLKPQTIEAIEILKTYKTPFIIAFNKVDKIQGWKTDRKKNMVETLNSLSPDASVKFETKFYQVVGQLSEQGLNTDRWDRVSDYTQQLAIIPCSAITGEGLPEILMLVSGLAQRFLNNNLDCDSEGFAKGTILELKEDKGLGKTVNVILYDGKLKVNDTIVLGTVNEPIITKVRALLEPKPLAEMMDKKNIYKSTKEVHAATGIKISAPNLENAMSGMPIRSCKPEDAEKVAEEIKNEIEEVMIETDKEGIVIKADALGSLEALSKLLRDNDVPIRKATIGDIAKLDISDAESSYEKDPTHSCILAFNSNISKDIIVPDHVKIISSNVIYHIIETYKEWSEEMAKNEDARELDSLVRPFKFEVMSQYIFRQSNPAVFGADLIAGVIKVGSPLMKNNKNIGRVKGIKVNNENVKKAEGPKEVPLSVEGATIGRQIDGGDIIYSDIQDEEFKKLKELKKHLSKEELEVMKEIARIRRVNNPVWGI